ncbi:MAG: hypothetical protein RR066_01065 [Mucinivorans sp.]
MITLKPTSDNLYNVEYPGSLTAIGDNPSEQFLRSLLLKEPYNLGAHMALSDLLMDRDDVEEACEQRLMGAQMTLDALSEDEAMEINMSHEKNHVFVEIIFLSGYDHYVFGDFEMAAAMFETVMELDPEDHFGAALPLTYCYIALGEWELFEEHYSPALFSRLEAELIEAWAAQRQNKSFTISVSLRDELSNHQSELWQATEHLWMAFPEFLATK